MTYWPFPHSSPQQPIWNFQDLKFQIPSPPSVGSFSRPWRRRRTEVERVKREDQVKVKKSLFVVNCEVKILEDWFLGQSHILQIPWNCVVAVGREESPSSCPLDLVSRIRWSGFVLNWVKFSSQEEFVKSSCGQVDVNCLVSFTRHLLQEQQVPWSRSNWNLNCEIGEAVKSGTPEDSSRSFLEV